MMKVHQIQHSPLEVRRRSSQPIAYSYQANDFSRALLHALRMLHLHEHTFYRTRAAGGTAMAATWAYYALARFGARPRRGTEQSDTLGLSTFFLRRRARRQ